NRSQPQCTIADNARLPFPENQFRGGARGNQRMKSADGAASNGDVAERENLSGKDWPGSIDEASEGRHQYLRAHQQDTSGKGKDDARLDERDQVIERRQ